MTPPEGHDDLEKWPAPPEAGLGAATGRGSNWITGLNQLSRDGDGNGKRHLRFWLWLIFPPAPYVRSTYPPKYPILLPFSYLRRWLSWAREVIFTTKST
jgi:hypothetical protein